MGPFFPFQDELGSSNRLPGTLGESKQPRWGFQELMVRRPSMRETGRTIEFFVSQATMWNFLEFEMTRYRRVSQSRIASELGSILILDMFVSVSAGNPCDRCAQSLPMDCQAGWEKLGTTWPTDAERGNHGLALSSFSHHRENIETLKIRRWLEKKKRRVFVKVQC